MPKSTFVKDPVDDHVNEIGKQIRLEIVTSETKRNITRAETIRHSGMSQASFYTAWRDPALFRVGQLIRIYEYLKVPEEKRRFI